MSDPMSILNQPYSPPELPNPYAPPTAPDLAPGAAPEPDKPLEPAGFLIRAGARLLDMGIHLGLGFVTGLIVAITTGIVATIRGIPYETLWANAQPVAWIGWLSGMLGSILYQVIAEGWHGSSSGKILLGLVVLQENGRPCTPLQALMRELAYFIDVLFFGLIAYSQMSKSPLKQRLGDDWADTVVVFRRSAPSHSLRSGLQFVGVLLLAAGADVAILSLPFFLRLFGS